MLDAGLLALFEDDLPDELLNARPENRQDVPEKRPPLTPDERHAFDEQTAQRLLRLGREPFRSDRRVFQDVEVEPGRLFEPPAYRERLAFARILGKRAARTSAEFDLFKEGRDLSNTRHFLLRPRPAKAAPGKAQAAKAAIGELAAELERFADKYNTFTKRLVSEGLLRPLLTVVHIRFDLKMGRWDVHAHCLWDVAIGDLDTVRQRIGTKFSTPWSGEKPLINPASVVNYMTQWVVDHREMQRWPDDALLELWDLDRPRLVRPAGEFAVFRRQIADHQLERSGSTVTVLPKKPRQMRREALWRGAGSDGVVGYVRLRLDGCRRLCAVLAPDPRSVPAPHTGSGEPATTPEATSRGYSTTNLGLTLPSTGHPVPSVTPSSIEVDRDTHAFMPKRIPYRMRWMWQAWPYGGKRPLSRREGNGKPARPIQRRIRRFLEDQARRALEKPPDG
ncbi:MULTISPECIES: hypothetical protein [Hyphomicrobiales]|jgi:hypothetical protein|uniref:Replication endonuclease n=1 Tax=Bosea massiliensis TaxID=151419 RepID=A0ABW0PB07_9HYPH|nr:MULTISPECIES: hypothetical protein [Hyphomicrobiales]